MRKRSKHVALAIVGAAAFALAGCTDEQVEATAFPDLASCKEAASLGGQFSSADCDTAFAEAQALHVETAPRYDSVQVCEEVHGAGNCGTEAQASEGGSGSIFMPMIMGYLLGSMMGNMMGGGRGAAQAPSQPMYKTASGGYTNATGTATYSTNKGTGKMSASQFAKPPSTIDKAPMSKGTAVSRGGFGSSNTASGG